MRYVIEKLKQTSIKYMDGNSLLEELYWCYTECNSIDDPELRTQFEKVYRSMPELSERKFDNIFSEISELSIAHEKVAFQAGIKVGLQLALELLE